MTIIASDFSQTTSEKEWYDTIDDIGNNKRVKAGDIVYQKYIDISEKDALKIRETHIKYNYYYCS